MSGSAFKRALGINIAGSCPKSTTFTAYVWRFAKERRRLVPFEARAKPLRCEIPARTQVIKQTWNFRVCRRSKWRHRRICWNLETYGDLSQLQGYRFTSGFFLWSSQQGLWTLLDSSGCSLSLTVCEKVQHPVCQNSHILLGSDYFPFKDVPLW